MKIFDLTKEISLDSRLQKKYDKSRAALYLFFLAACFFAADKLLFPSVTLDFSFNSLQSLKNTIVSPRIGTTLPTKGVVNENEILTFDTNPIGNFSDATVSFTDASAKNLQDTQISIRKSYQAFFYPTGKAAAFKNGTLLTHGANYYLVSRGEIRKFSKIETILELGYPKNAFMEVSLTDLGYNTMSAEITDSKEYPDDTLFFVAGDYYQVKNRQLVPFISANAFLSQFDEIQAIIKNSEFLSEFSISENFIGYADGTLASADQAVYVLSEGKSYPFESAETFIAMGYDWNEVKTIDPEEFSLYEKQKQFTHNQPHPNGTLFLDQDTQQHFIIKNGQKLPIQSEAVLKNLLRQKPISASSKNSEVSTACKLEKKFWSKSLYECTLNLASMNKFVGNDYQIDAKFPSTVKIRDIHTTFSTPFTLRNFWSSLSRIKQSLLNNYSQNQ